MKTMAFAAAFPGLRPVPRAEQVAKSANWLWIRRRTLSASRTISQCRWGQKSVASALCARSTVSPALRCSISTRGAALPTHVSPGRRSMRWLLPDSHRSGVGGGAGRLPKAVEKGETVRVRVEECMSTRWGQDGWRRDGWKPQWGGR